MSSFQIVDIFLLWLLLSVFGESFPQLSHKRVFFTFSSRRFIIWVHRFISVVCLELCVYVLTHIHTFAYRYIHSGLRLTLVFVLQIDNQLFPYISIEIFFFQLGVLIGTDFFIYLCKHPCVPMCLLGNFLFYLLILFLLINTVPLCSVD